ncbi:hydroxyacylglutathione hydrolase [Bartonella sp. DGB2]|uniref:hydroxyacylglutathione hydrolase n=1 Tax=Bartonella sp. DGB2 TaxID=3388426 RepID=UPI0039901FA2
MLIELFLCRDDNFGLLLHNEQSGYTISIDAPDAFAIKAALERRGWCLDTILLTHHHYDHVEGVGALQDLGGVSVYGPAPRSSNLPLFDYYVQDGEVLFFEDSTVRVIATPGHTRESVCYYFEREEILCSGDTLFSLGCGRLFTKDACLMQSSLAKLRALPDQTQLYCGHEYSQANAHFALQIEPHNYILQNRLREINQQRANGVYTLPVSLGAEKAANPFLRWDSPKIRQNLGLVDASDEIVFARIRQLKDQFHI